MYVSKPYTQLYIFWFTVIVVYCSLHISGCHKNKMEKNIGTALCALSTAYGFLTRTWLVGLQLYTPRYVFRPEPSRRAQ